MIEPMRNRRPVKRHEVRVVEKVPVPDPGQNTLRRLGLSIDGKMSLRGPDLCPHSLGAEDPPLVLACSYQPAFIIQGLADVVLDKNIADLASSDNAATPVP
jgi:hypothetical protein